MNISDNIHKLKENLKREFRKEALKEAIHIACILQKRFGAKEIILYGSLAKEKYFDTASDIDLVVKGLGDKYLKAYGYCLRLSKFNLDIRAYEDMPLNFRKKVDKYGRYLYRCKEMRRKK
ncbi:MAG: nucleotidyltransferase domain-containing protein [Candidatus Omnitrophica bacterium]|nr:nucleotidyltransferase domain-containing protein [Candidatus Omnitrophota bacterium]